MNGQLLLQRQVLAVSANPVSGTGEGFTFEPRVDHPAVVEFGLIGQQGSVDESTAIEFEISVIRQEYVNHGINVPDRAAFNTPVATTNFVIEVINRTPYDQIIGTPGTLAESVRTAYNIGIQNQLGLVVPPDYGLRLTSTWRNPERNEISGGVLNSNHQLGDAVDMVILHSTPAATGLTRAQLWQILEDAGADVIGNTNDSFCEMGPTIVFCDGTQGAVSHVHVEQ